MPASDAPPARICTSFTSLVGLATHLCYHLLPEVRQEVGRYTFRQTNIAMEYPHVQ